MFCVAHEKSGSIREDLFFTPSTTSCVRDRLSRLGHFDRNSNADFFEKNKRGDS